MNESASTGGHHGAVMPTMTAIVPRSSLRIANSASCHGSQSKIPEQYLWPEPG
ncbi:hypothetical protein RBSWK_04452 [Rhodopirellula baltica SWK14]|uniref:Uncharacterized protein n=1 Tax=Rhodopirellula baltica SWK14 TaxID=993516 RepID=L7CBS4_RHOBT|nr:hypothetical protein RBSWK_04452 [Rhodopirellula baltica SWK14]